MFYYNSGKYANILNFASQNITSGVLYYVSDFIISIYGSNTSFTSIV